MLLSKPGDYTFDRWSMSTMVIFQRGPFEPGMPAFAARLLRLARSVTSVSRRDGGIRFAIHLHVLRFCEAAGCGVRLEPRSLHLRTRLRRAQVRCCCSFWNDMATGLALFCVLDHHHDPIREFDKHEWGDHSSFSIANRSRHHSRKCGPVRVNTRWVEPAGQRGSNHKLISRQSSQYI